MTAVGVIPARFRASRFPGKPLAEIAGRPMIEWVVEGARQARSLREVWVATDDERIVKVCEAFGAPVVMTSPDHPTGTDRLAEVARGLSDEIVVNIQGDEPLIEGRVIDAAVDALLAAPDASMSTLVHPADESALADPNRVKAVLDREGNALWFSRLPIPFAREGAPKPRVWQHVGLYAYRRDFLVEFVDLEPGEAEQAEALEQLRALEHGHRIRAAVITGWHGIPVDRPEDVARVEAALAARGDPARPSA
ncbi:MAG: 3-deoxy-manno-octulosonate cytidylyltransferase [Myxococcota bacterium]|nr:3-deoxy-manno-octulosonate cytidylyltransferase [Myxococcota bacterium]